MYTATVNKIDNQQFCYWLQGYFEISKEPVSIKQQQIELISNTLDSIVEPLRPLQKWLKSVCDYCKMQNYRAETIAYFQPLIQNTLGNLFLHVIDDSYESSIPYAELQMIHDGKIEYDKR